MSRDTSSDVYNEDMSCEQLPLPDNLADAHRTIRELRLQIERMQRQLEQLSQQRHGPKSEKHHAEQLLLFGEAAVELPPAPPQPEPRSKTGHGRQRLPTSLPRQ
jgi:transposase